MAVVTAFLHISNWSILLQLIDLKGKTKPSFRYEALVEKSGTFHIWCIVYERVNTDTCLLIGVDLSPNVYEFISHCNLNNRELSKVVPRTGKTIIDDFPCFVLVL
jgi:hypothetical protein